MKKVGRALEAVHDENREGTGRYRRGSALVLTLMVVSLLLIIVLGFSLFVRMQLREVAQQQQLFQARANARLGMGLALARLQSAAGPDTRVTAPVARTPASPPNLAWLYRGIDSAPVIESGGSVVLNPRFGADAGVLLSHDPSTPFPANYWPFLGGREVADGNALLVGAGSVSDRDDNSDGVPDGLVAAPLRTIDGGSGGQYAFWVQDQGALARANLTEPEVNAAGDPLTDRERATTAQRVGVEALAPAFDETDPVHQRQMASLETPEQLNLTGFADPDSARELFHHVTLRSAGLPVNVRRGGFQRDLTAVLREMEANGGEVDPAGTQWTALTDYQADRISLWRSLTTSLPVSPPSNWMAGAPAWKRTAQWNALTALTLRQEQADTAAFSDKLFPPNSDLALQWDPGGPFWGQMLGYATLAERRMDGDGRLVASASDPETMNVQPVIARFSLSYYFTLDWPTLRIHFIPAVVLWNPYNKPLRPPPGREWQVIWAYEAQIYEGYGVSFQVSHPSWRGGDRIWTPTYRLPWQHNNNDGQFLFRLTSASPSTPVVIPPGEAVFFTMDEHARVEQNIQSSYNNDHKWRDLYRDRVPQNTIIDLVQGMHGDGGYGFYVEHRDMDDRILNLAAKGPRREFSDPDRDDWSPSGYWNEWDEAGLPFSVYQEEVPEGSGNLVEVDGTLPPEGTETHGSDYPVNYARNRVTGADRPIAVNESGLDGWRFHAATAVVSGKGGGSEFRPRGIRLGTAAAGTAYTDLRREDAGDVVLRYLYLRTPWALDNARPTDFDDPNKPNILPLFTTGFPSFNDSQPFNETSSPQFPAWGHVFGLRMPDSSFSYDQTAADGEGFTQGGHFGAPARWLIDHNPSAPFQMPDPVGRMRDRQYRGSYQNPGAYIGGFTVDPAAFKLPQFNPPGTGNQFIGWSDDLPPAGSLEPGWLPRFSLVDVPEGSEDLASPAAFSHTRFTNHRDFADRHVQTDYSANVPAYPIGNSYAPVLLPRDRAVKSFWPPPGQTGPGEPVPYSSSQRPNDYHVDDVSFYPGYDFSWLLNHVLWDDFFLTPDANARLHWRNGTADLQNDFGSLRRDFNRSGEKVEILGAFNVNSLSVPAWTALFQSTLGVEVDGTDGVDAAEEIPLNRFLEPLSDPYSPASGDTYDHTRAYTGYRRLTREEAERLAVEMVEQVRDRGPFLSMSDFVNRSLVPNDASLVSSGVDPRPFALAGALQAAIDNAGLNDSIGTAGDDYTSVEPSDLEVGTWNGTHRFHGMTLENFQGQKAAGVPGHLLASDVLTRLGGVLSVRSDTFRIRSYGSLGGAANGEPEAEAWVEAVVRRRPEWVDDANAPGDAGGTLSPLNRSFGRRFELVSFRYLGREDI